MNRLYRLLYAALWLICLPFVVVYSMFQFRSDHRFYSRIKERLGFFPEVTPQGSVWIHAASMGEVNAAVPLIKQLKLLSPNTPLVITTFTHTGSAHVQRLYPDIFHVYLPFDYPAAVKRTLKRIKPRFIMIMETEIWPALLMEAHDQSIPVVFANARMTEKTFATYQKLSRWLPFANCIDLVLAQSKQDAERFCDIQVPRDRVHALGNTKYDTPLNTQITPEWEPLKKAVEGRWIWLAASTHPGEETEIIAAFREIKTQSPEAMLWLAPRHPYRFADVAAICSATEFSYECRSTHPLPSRDVSIYLIDTLGELAALYGLVNVAFIGGTLIPIGGHNVMEAIVRGVPVLVGPFDETIRDVCKGLIEAGLCQRVLDRASLTAAVKQHLAKTDTHLHQHQQALHFLQQHQGTVEAHWSYLREYLLSA